MKKFKVQKSKIKVGTSVFAAFFVVFSSNAQETDSVKTDTVKHKVEVRDVIISSVKAGDKDPFVQTTVSHQQLNERNSGKDLPYLLDNQANVVSTSDAGTGTGYTGMKVRGSDLTRINVTINGIPANDPESQGVYFVDIPDIASNAGNIQLQRGVGSSGNGSGAFGATMNVQTNDFSRTPYGHAAVYYGSFNTFKANFRGGSGLLKNKFFVEASASHISSDGYIQRASSSLWSYYFQMGLVLKKTKIQLVHFSGFEKTYQAWNGVPQDSLATNRTYNDLGTDNGRLNPPYFNQTDNYQQEYLQLFVNHSFNAKWSLGGAGFATFGKGYYEEYHVAQNLADYGLTGIYDTTVSDLTRRLWLKNVYYGVLVSANYTSKKWDVKFGGMLAQYQSSHYGNVNWCAVCERLNPETDYYFSSGLKRDFNVYAKANYSPAKWITLYADLQYRYVQHIIKGTDDGVSGLDINKKWHFVNPKAGVKFFIKEKHQLYGSFAVANKEPGRDDIIINLGGSIKPERLYDTEIGYKFSGKRVTVEADYFLMYYHNQLLLSGQLNYVGNSIKINTPKSFRTGVELSTGAALWQSKKDKRHLLAANFNVSYSLNRIVGFTDKIPVYDDNYNLINYLSTYHKTSTISFSPSWVGAFTLSSEPIKNLTAKVFIKLVSKQYLDNTQNEARSIPAYAYGDISLSYLLPLKGKKSVRFSATVFNFWNQKYLTNGWTYSEAYQSSGITSQPYSYNYYFPQATIHANGGVEFDF